VTAPAHPERAETYESYFGLAEPPFSLAPDPRFLFASESHSDALAQVAYALERREPLVVITGEIGTGKTLLCRTVLQQLRRKTFLSVIGDPLLERDDLLKQLLEDFGVISKDRSRVSAASRHDLFHALQSFLASLAPIQAHAVVIIDEAQHLHPEVLEEIRLLSNVDDQRGTLLQIILVGQTNLEPLLARPELRQLQQRVTRRLRLEPLNRDEVERYITHRLALAHGDDGASHRDGGQALQDFALTGPGVEFTPGAIHAVSQLSGGLPRVINVLCDRALEDAFAARVRTIDGRLIHEAASDLGIGQPSPPPVAVDLAAPPIAVASALPAIEAPLEPIELMPDFVPEAPPAHAATPAMSAAAPPQVDPDRSFWSATRIASDSTVKPVQREEAPAAPAGPTRRAPAPRFAMALVLAGAVAFGAVGIWLAVRTSRPQEAAAPRTPAPKTTAPLVLSPRPDPPPPVASVSVPGTAATTGTPAPQATPPPAPAAVDQAPAAAGRFDIIVASFRTELRASSVANEVATLGLPIRRRFSDGWHQVISGPFATRLDAEDAQRRLDRAGLSGTQIAPSGR
jgi:type II secretory pathway predicted ATPase ExeA/cell division protein FtsN